MAEPATFSPAARAVLEKAGWTDDYVCPALEEYCRVLAEDGYEVSGAAREFLRRFGGLLFETFDTLADVAVDHDVAGWAGLWSEMVGSPVCLVGNVYGGHMIVAMDERGRVFAAQGVLVVHVGDSGVEAVENLCTGAGYPWPQLPYPDNVRDYAPDRAVLEEAPAERRPGSSFRDGLRKIFRMWER